MHSKVCVQDIMVALGNYGLWYDFVMITACKHCNAETSPQNTIDYELQATSTGVCITCTFLDSSFIDCVAVVHQRISQLSSSGLMNIESSHKFTRSGDNAYGCIEGVNLEQYQVGVVGGSQRFAVDSSKTSNCFCHTLSPQNINFCLFLGLCKLWCIIGIGKENG